MKTVAVRTYNKEEMTLALQEKMDAEKRGDQVTLYNVLQRLERTGKIKNPEVIQEEISRLLSMKGLRTVLNAKGYQLGDGTYNELETAVLTLIEVAVKTARLCHRKTVKPGDITGQSLSAKS